MAHAHPCGRMILVLGLVFLLVGAVPTHAEGRRESVTGILGAFAEEAKIIREEMSRRETHRFMGIEFVTGELAGRQIVLALTGVGKVNAAMITTLLLDHFQPTEVIFTGIAGGINPELQPGDIVIAEKLAQHDLGGITSEGFKPEPVRNPVDGQRNPLFIPSDKALVELAERMADKIEFTVPGGSDRDRTVAVVKGVVVTGDVFVASEEKKSTLLTQFGADATEMEGAAVAQICFQQRVPFIVLRSLSDSADDNANRDLRHFYRAAAKNSAALTMALVQELAKVNIENTSEGPKGADNDGMKQDGNARRACATAACADACRACTMEPIDIVTAAAEAINEGRIDDALVFYSDSVVQRSPDPHSTGFKVQHGKEALRCVLESDIRGRTKAVFRYERLIARDNVVAAQVTNYGCFNGIHVEQPAALFFDIEDSRIQAVTIYYDRLAIRRIMEQSARGAQPGAAAGLDKQGR